MERTLDSSSFSNQAVEASLFSRVIDTLALWQERVSSRRQLARLDARLLSDAGISEDQRVAELAKPFWR